jgi:NTE family protein
MKALVISGGGSKGAFGGGIAQYLIKDLGNNYDLVVGTSTGSLMSPLLATGELDKLKIGYTSVTQKDIFKVNPFKKGSTDFAINFWAVIYNFLRGKHTFGDSSNLSDLIKKFFTEQDYQAIKTANKNVVVSVSDTTKECPEYKSMQDCSYDDFCDWMQASASAAPFMSYVSKDDCDYVDGGIFVPVPIQEAIDRGATEIDVIILHTEHNVPAMARISNVFQLITKITDCMLTQLGQNDVVIASLLAADKDVTLNMYYTPRVLTSNYLIFDQAEMKGWWDEGYAYAKTRPHTSYLITKDSKPKKIYTGQTGQI